MCPEYGIYHTRLPQQNGGFLSKKKADFLPLNDIKVNKTYTAGI